MFSFTMQWEKGMEGVSDFWASNKAFHVVKNNSHKAACVVGETGKTAATPLSLILWTLSDN